MRTFTTEHTVYTFNELSDEAKQKAIEDYRDGLMFDSLEEIMHEELTEVLLPKYKIKPVEVDVHFSLGYSQGDGASFTGDIEWGAYRATIGKNHWGMYYSHAKSVDVKELNSLKTDKEAPDKKWAELQAIVQTIGEELGKHGYTEIEYQSSDAVISDYLSSPDYEFTVDGDVA